MRESVGTTTFDHFCTVERRTQSGTEPSGAPTYTWSVLHDNIPCHFWESSEEELIGNEQVVITRRRLILPATIDIRPDDKVTELTGYDGAISIAPLNILHVMKRVSETVCMLQEIT